MDDRRHEHDAPRAAHRPGDALLTLLRRPLDAASLERNAEDAAAMASTDEGRTRTLIIFSLAGELFALPAGRLRRADQATIVRPVPHRRGGAFRGLCAVRGELALCVDLAQALGLPQRDAVAERASRRMILFGDAGRAWAAEVDGLIGVHGMSADEMAPPPVTLASGPQAFVEGVIEVEVEGAARRVCVIDAERLIPAIERSVS